MTREQEFRTRRLAKRAALSDVSHDRELTKARAEWWVGYLSHDLEIVNADGMIDMAGAIAGLFVWEYRRVYKNTPRAIGEDA